MVLKDLKNWVNSIPEDYDEYNLVYRKIFEKDEQLIAHDISITSGTVDTGTKEICLYEQKSYELTQK